MGMGVSVGVGMDMEMGIGYKSNVGGMGSPCNPANNIGMGYRRILRGRELYNKRTRVTNTNCRGERRVDVPPL